jgi:hypothetical protein
MSMSSNDISPPPHPMIPPVIGTSPSLPPSSNRNSGFLPQFFAILLSLCLGLFLADAFISLADASLVLFCGLHLFSAVSTFVSFFGVVMAVGVYVLIGLTPLVPKRLFLPIPLFYLLATLVLFPFAIYYYGRIQQFTWGAALTQVVVGLWILYRDQGGLKFRWPLVSVGQLGIRRFSWWNLSTFILLNIFVLLPAIIVYLFLCTATAVDHFSDGFMELRPGGFTVQVRKYTRNDGKMIELFPMSHVADAGFYQKVSQTFPTNSIILMEGVSDNENLLTNKLSYKRMAKTLGLAEQKMEFQPTNGEMVRADVDVDQFSTNTIDFLNLVTLIHSKGVNSETMLKLVQSSPSPEFMEQLFDDLLTKRNEHLLEEIHSHLAQSDNLMVPWGVAHMPEIAKEIQKSGFRLEDTQEYEVIQFHGVGNHGKNAKQ